MQLFKISFFMQIHDVWEEKIFWNATFPYIVKHTLHRISSLKKERENLSVCLKFNFNIYESNKNIALLTGWV